MSHYLSSNGLNEIMSNSLFRSSQYGEELHSQLARIKNPLSLELDVMRHDLLMPMLDAAVYNQNRQRSDLRLYEFGKTYVCNGDGYSETNGLGVLMNGLSHPGSWDHKKEPFSFYFLKSMVSNVLDSSGYQLPASLS